MIIESLIQKIWDDTDKLLWNEIRELAKPVQTKSISRFKSKTKRKRLYAELRRYKYKNIDKIIINKLQ